MSDNNLIYLDKNTFLDSEKFIKNLLYSSVHIVADRDFISQGMSNKNIMFFLNCVIERIGSVSMLGSRNLGMSLLGKIGNIVNYYENVLQLFEKKEKIPTIPKSKRDYIKEKIKKNNIIDNDIKNKYLRFIGDNNISDNEFIENLKLIYSSLIEMEYFKLVSDKLYDLLIDKYNNEIILDEINNLTDEYISLLMDYIGISVFEIKKIIRDSFRKFFEKKDENIFLEMLSRLAERYNKNNMYLIFIKMDKSFDEKLITSLKLSGSNSYVIYSKTGFVKKLNEENIINKKNKNKIIEEYTILNKDNNYFLCSELISKDIWHAIKTFKQTTVQPFIGSMLYSGIKVKAQKNRYIVIEYQDDKSFIDEFSYHDDICKPLSQNQINYSDVFKRYIIENSENEINKIIDEAVQLLPYYKDSDSILTKFTNTWFALETLFRNSSDVIKTALDEYASPLVADRMIYGYIYVTASQIKRIYKNFQKLSKNFVENIFLNYQNYIRERESECQYLDWKYEKILKVVDNYEDIYNQNLIEARELLDNAYRLRNKQFHGTKDSQLEKMSGFLYDIVNDTISFYIDYLDVYKNNEVSFQSLYNIIKNIKLIKSSVIKEKKSYIEKISVLYDSVRKI